ncbi:MAG: transcriptional regulator [Verrucomicrobia bacterium]|nr:MAG: transcriptional regulator [Verrucomicrobiota bacterium]
MDSVLIVDDERHTRDGLSAMLADSYDVFAAANADEAIKMLDAEHFDAVVTDLRMAGKSGMSVIDKAISMRDRPACIMLTAYGNVETAVEAMKRGADDFLPKPVDIARLEQILKSAIEKRRAENSERRLRARNAGESACGEVAAAVSSPAGHIIAESAQMKAVVERAAQAAASKATVLLSGETGTGKELVARFIHEISPRRDAPFVPVHCAAIPANLLESELFGYERGAFTGATHRRIGRFEAADGGTIFLDEIGEIDHTTQVKLLRFLETRSFERLGGSGTISVNVRLVCATNRNLKDMVEKGEFREDLYYRLNVVEIRIPPLREHREDIPALIASYLAYYAAENSTRAPSVSDSAMKILSEYPWRGNIRELRNFCENAVVMGDGSDAITPQTLPAHFKLPPPPSGGETPEGRGDFSKKSNEFDLIRRALEASGGNKSKAAQLLGISRRTLHRKLGEMEP